MSKRVKSNYYIGVMSGTSIDSIDAVLMEIQSKSWSLLGTLSKKFPEQLRKDLLEVSRNKQKIDLRELIELDIKTGVAFAKCINALIKKAKINYKEINAIGLHGQTIMHHIHTKYPGSLQIGNPSTVAQITGIGVVCDFRNPDITSGGQGAPLAPVFHSWLFGTKKKNRVVVNIGGIANISFLGKNKYLSGYDIGPGNVLMDVWASKHNHGNYDNNGNWAKGGKINMGLLNSFKSDPFFKKKPPKSTGTDYFNLQWITDYCRQNTPDNLSPRDIQSTLLELTTVTIIDAIKAWPQSELAFCGGGVKNKHMIAILRKKLQVSLHSTTDWGIDPEWVEAAGFAYLAKQRIENNRSYLGQTTGSKSKVMLGAIYEPPLPT